MTVNFTGFETMVLQYFCIKINKLCVWFQLQGLIHHCASVGGVIDPREGGHIWSDLLALFGRPPEPLCNFI